MPKRGRPCTVCLHPERDAIDRALVGGATAGGITAQFRELSDDAVQRHRAGHIPATLARATTAREVARADDLLREAQALYNHAWGLLADAGGVKDATAAIREIRGCLELLGKLLGELQQPGVVNILVSAEWIQVRAVILRALDAYPDARVAVADALEAHAQP